MQLTDLYRSRGDEAAAEKVLRQAAVEELRLAARLNPDSPRYIYVYAVALNSSGQPEQVIMVLQGAHNSHPNNVDILNALIAFNRDAGNHEQANRYAQKRRNRSP